MKCIYPNYKECLVNLSASIEKYFGEIPHHTSLQEIDELLKNKNPKNVIVILYDGLGSKILEKSLDNNSFLRKNNLKDISSVYPSTTTAATTSFKTGLTPMEHGWLGWDVYIKSIDKIITLYRNIVKDTEETAADYNVANKEFPIIDISDKINKKGKYNSYIISPFEGDNTYDQENIDEMHKLILKYSRNEGKNYIYAYSAEPDHSMHEFGTKDRNVLSLISNINSKTEKLCEQLEDSVIFVIADHGHIDADCIILEDYPVLQNMLVRETSIEPRAVNFFVKKEMIDEFKIEFNKEFGNDFILLSKEEVIDKKIYGEGTENLKFRDCLGDYLALAISDKYILDSHSSKTFKSVHAGLTEDEMLIPLIIIDKTNKKS